MITIAPSSFIWRVRSACAHVAGKAARERGLVTDSARRLARAGGGYLLLIITTALLLSTADPARADEVSALYQAYWAGMPAGQIRLTLREASGTYREEISIRSEGLPRVVTRFRGTAVSEGRITAERPPEPAHYDAVYDLRKSKNKRLAMRFVSRTGASIADRGPEDTSKKPPLAEEFRRNVIDPLSALAAIRHGLQQRKTNFTVPVYDGARRFDVLVKVLPKPKAADPYLPVELTLRPIAGFKGDASDDGDPDDAPRPVALKFTDDARLVPVSMTVSIYYLPLVVELTKWCDTGAVCGW
jgi:hypothetical protein